MTIGLNISLQQIADQLVTAFEGGINYWCDKASVFDQNKNFLSDNDIVDHPERLKNGTIRIHDAEQDKWYEIPFANIHHGLELMNQNSIQHFADMKNDSGDAITADVFVQYITFGKLIYG